MGESQAFLDLLFKNKITQKGAAVLLNIDGLQFRKTIKTGKVPFHWLIIIELHLELRKKQETIDHQQNLLDKISICSKDIIDFVVNKKALTVGLRKDYKAKRR